MLSANILSSTINRLFGGVANRETMLDKALNQAHGAMARRYAAADPALFDRDFVHTTGKPIIDAFLDGKQPRHAAAEALSRAWNTDMGPISSRAARLRVADTTMMADVFLSELGMILDR